ncbi:NUDIX domain-containing protein [Streptomyces sp. NPDC002130]|uniref:NUDIX domain-containing protein n=1 Tax=Streptomyces sp. NPDC002130 TaxID=3155568 RepID=UPI00332561C8
MDAPGEDPLQTARREAVEETGLHEVFEIACGFPLPSARRMSTMCASAARRATRSAASSWAEPARECSRLSRPVESSFSRSWSS